MKPLARRTIRLPSPRKSWLLLCDPERVRLPWNVNKVDDLQQNGGQRRGHPGYVGGANNHTWTGGPFVEAAYNKTAPISDLFSPAREAFDRMTQHLESTAALAMNHMDLE